MDAAGELALNPLAGFARVAPHEEPQPAPGRGHCMDERGAKAGHGFMVERELPRLAADTVRAEKLLGH